MAGAALGRAAAAVLAVKLIKQDNGWKIDDIAGQEAGPKSWRLSDILAGDPQTN